MYLTRNSYKVWVAHPSTPFLSLTIPWVPHPLWRARSCSLRPAQRVGLQYLLHAWSNERLSPIAFFALGAVIDFVIGWFKWHSLAAGVAAILFGLPATAVLFLIFKASGRGNDNRDNRSVIGGCPPSRPLLSEARVNNTVTSTTSSTPLPPNPPPQTSAP